MHIGIDARLYNQTGVGRYIQNLLRELAIIDKRNNYIIYLKEADFSDFTPPNKRWQKQILNIPWHTAQEQIVLPYILLKAKLDVVHFPYFNVPIFYPKKYVLTIHDLILDHFDTGRASTHFYPFYKLKRLGYKISLSTAIRKACNVMAISETTKKEILDHYYIQPSKITVTNDAVDQSFKKCLENIRPKRLFRFPYIFYVGNAYPHKNLERLIEAFLLIRQKRKIKLVLAGDDQYFFPRLKKYTENRGGLRDVIFFGTADNKALVDLYSNALCLVSPSLMEGFGLPNLEAVVCGRLPVVSDIPSYREIWGDDVTCFDPYDIDDMTVKILEVLDYSEKEYKKRVIKARSRMSGFSWRKTASDTLRVYENCFSL